MNHWKVAFHTSYLASKTNEKKMNKQNAQGGYYKYEKPDSLPWEERGLSRLVLHALEQKI